MALLVAILLIDLMVVFYGGGERVIEIASETAVWYSTGLFAVPLLRWVLVGDPEKEFKTQALLSAPISMPSPSG